MHSVAFAATNGKFQPLASSTSAENGRHASPERNRVAERSMAQNGCWGLLPEASQKPSCDPLGVTSLKTGGYAHLPDEQTLLCRPARRSDWRIPPTAP